MQISPGSMLLELKGEALSRENPSSDTRTPEHDLYSPSIEYAEKIEPSWPPPLHLHVMSQ